MGEVVYIWKDKDQEDGVATGFLDRYHQDRKSVV